MRNTRRRSLVAFVALGLSVLIISVATLTPSYETASAERPFCLLCGERGTADAIDNVLLFLPLGLSLGLLGLTVFRALVAGGGLSALVELAQFAIVPGRDASPGDLLFNTLGAGLGCAAVHTTIRWLYPEPKAAGWLSLVAATLAATVVALTGYLLAPSLPDSPYAGQWTESPGNLELYQGTILEATLGPVPVPARPLAHPGQIRDLLLTGAPLDIRLIAGPPTSRLGQLFAIVEDGPNREVLLLGVDGDDLVIRYHTRANELRLDAGTLRVSNALAGVSPGTSVRLVVWREADEYCVAVNTMRTCRMAFSAANGWMVLYSVASWPGWLRTVLGIGWLAVLFMPVGLWLRRHWASFLALLLIAMGLAILPGVVGLSPPPAIESTGAVIGILLGVFSAVHAKRLVPAIPPENRP